MDRKFYKLSANTLRYLDEKGQWHANGGIVYYHKKAGWFSSEITKRLLELYLYEDDDVFYDIFGNTKVGERKKSMVMTG